MEPGPLKLFRILRVVIDLRSEIRRLSNNNNLKNIQYVLRSTYFPTDEAVLPEAKYKRHEKCHESRLFENTKKIYAIIARLQFCSRPHADTS